MSTDYTRNLSTKAYVDDQNPDGMRWSSNPKSSPAQGLIQGSFSLGIMKHHSANAGALAATVHDRCAAQAVTVTGLLTTDFVVAVAKATNQTGITIAGAYANAANSLELNLANPTAANITPTANEAYNAVVLRGMNTITQAKTIAAFTTAVNAPGMSETVYTFGSTSGMVCTPVIEGGKIVAYNVSTASTAVFNTPPTVTITPKEGYSGFGATAIAVLNASGVVVSIIPTAFGSGYTSGQVTVDVTGGNLVAPGMIAQVNYPVVANMGIGNVRVVGPNQIAVTAFSLGTGTVTPTANANAVFGAFSHMVATSPMTYVGFTAATNFANVAANNLTVFHVPTPGVLTTDLAMPVIPPAGSAPQANLLFGGSTANVADNLDISFGGAGVSAVTTAAGIYTIPVLRQSQWSPMPMVDLYLTPAACAANTATEQVFTLPFSLTIPTLCPILVNWQSYIQGCTISTHGRANSTTTLGITFINNTTASITPPPSMFRVASFPALIPTLSANVTESTYRQTIGISLNRMVGLQNELQQSLCVMGMIAGA